MEAAIRSYEAPQVASAQGDSGCGALFNSDVLGH